MQDEDKEPNIAAENSSPGRGAGMLGGAGGIGQPTMEVGIVLPAVNVFRPGWGNKRERHTGRAAHSSKPVFPKCL